MGGQGAGHGRGELFRNLGLGKQSQAEMGLRAFPLGDEELGQPCMTWCLLPPTPQPVQSWFRGGTGEAHTKHPILIFSDLKFLLQWSTGGMCKQGIQLSLFSQLSISSSSLGILPLHLLELCLGQDPGLAQRGSVSCWQGTPEIPGQVRGGAWLHGLCFQMCVQAWSLHGELINCWPSWKGCIFFFF